MTIAESLRSKKLTDVEITTVELLTFVWHVAFKISYLDQDNDTEWYKGYELERKKQDKLVSQYLDSCQLCSWERTMVEAYYTLGKSPRWVKGIDY